MRGMVSTWEVPVFRSIVVRVLHVILAIKLFVTIPGMCPCTVSIVMLRLKKAFMVEISHFVRTMVALHHIMEGLCMFMAEVMVVFLILVVWVEFALLQVQESMVVVVDRMVVGMLLMMLWLVHVMKSWFKPVVWGIMHWVTVAMVWLACMAMVWLVYITMVWLVCIAIVWLVCIAMVVVWLLPVVIEGALVSVHIRT